MVILIHNKHTVKMYGMQDMIRSGFKKCTFRWGFGKNGEFFTPRLRDRLYFLLILLLCEIERCSLSGLKLERKSQEELVNSRTEVVNRDRSETSHSTLNGRTDEPRRLRLSHFVPCHLPLKLVG